MTAVLAFGAGVQSTALAMLALSRDIRLVEYFPDPIDLMVFSDPGSESSATYRLVEVMRAMAAEKGVPFKVARYSGARQPRLADSLAADENFSTIPAFTVGTGSGGRGQLMRACSRDYKIRPIATSIREHLGVSRVTGQVVDIWLGISVDEVQRAKPETEIKWQRRVFPLLDMRWRRSDCVAYLQGFLGDLGEVARSACVFCPYHSNREWRALYAAGGDDWAHAVEVDETMRNLSGRGGIRETAYLHRSLRPLSELPFLDDDGGQLDLWAGECEGICGL